MLNFNNKAIYLINNALKILIIAVTDHQVLLWSRQKLSNKEIGNHYIVNLINDIVIYYQIRNYKLYY